MNMVHGPIIYKKKIYYIYIMNLPNKPNLNRPINVSYYWDWFTEQEKDTYNQGKWNEDVSNVNQYVAEVERILQEQKQKSDETISNLRKDVSQRDAKISNQKNTIKTLTNEKNIDLIQFSIQNK